MLAAVEDVAEAHDATPVQVAIAWLLEQDAVTAPIVGPKNREQLQDLLGSLALDLHENEVERIDEPKTPRWPARRE